MTIKNKEVKLTLVYWADAAINCDLNSNEFVPGTYQVTIGIEHPKIFTDRHGTQYRRYLHNVSSRVADFTDVPISLIIRKYSRAVFIPEYIIKFSKESPT